MFKITQSATYFWSVPIEIAVDSKKIKQSLELEFKRILESEMIDYLEKVSKNEIKPIDFIKAIVVGWKNVVDNGQPIEFSESMLERLVDNNGGAGGAIIEAFTASRYTASSKN